jgi:hypothetical protein
MRASIQEREPKQPLILEPEGRFNLPTRVFSRGDIGFVLNHVVILYDITRHSEPPKTDLLQGSIRISQPATIGSLQVGWWSGVYVPPVEGDSDYMDLPRDHPFTD